MANTASAKKRVRQNEKRRLRNLFHKSRMKTFIKKARRAIDAKDLTLAEDLVRQAVRYIDRTAERGVIHRNTAARYKSRLMRAFNKAKNDSS